MVLVKGLHQDDQIIIYMNTSRGGLAGPFLAQWACFACFFVAQNDH